MAALHGRSPRGVGALGLGLLVVLVVLLGALGAGQAWAYECSGGSRPFSECVEQPLNPPGGGPDVMPTTTTYFVYWQPKGAPAFPAGYESAITAFFKGVEHDNGSDQNFYSVLGQYGANYETHFGKAIKDKNPYPAESSDCSENSEGPPPSKPCISTGQVKAEVQALLKDHKLPAQAYEAGRYSSQEATHSYFVLLPPGVSVCDRSQGCSARFCAYHDAILTSEPAENLVFAVMPYLPVVKACADPQHPNGAYEDEFPALEHEFAEMATDPYGGGWANEPVFGSEEVADICADGAWGAPSAAFEEKMRWGTSLGTAPDGALYNQVIDGHDYYLQQLYSNATESCVQRKALPPVVSKLAPAKGPLAGNTKVKITGLNFENPTVTSVSFGKTAAKSFTVTSPTSITAVSPEAAAAGPVAVTVTSTAGTSASVPADQFTYQAK